jgi:formate C-acetyltransferase
MELSARMEKLKTRLFEVEYHDPGVWHFKNVNILDQWPEIRDEPMVVRKGHAQKYIGEYLPVNIKPDELIVGNPNQNSVGWGSVLPRYYTEDEGEQAARYELNECSLWGHHPPDWSEILKHGVIGVKVKVKKKLMQQQASCNPDEVAMNNYRAMLVALDGLAAFARRYSHEAGYMASREKDPARREELLSIQKICARVPELPAETYHEALQSFWFTYCMVNSGGEFVPFGRADQHLYPYYQRDRDAGRITEAEAIDLLASFLVKCNERVILDTHKSENHYNFGFFSQGQVPTVEIETSGTNQTGGYDSRALTWQDGEDINSEANFNYGQSGNDWLMNCMVGGVHADGTDATNPLSRWFIDIYNAMDLLMPTLGARVHKNSPQDYVDLIARVLRYGQGEPIIYNDDAIIPGFVDLGVPVEEARDYSHDGCWETLVQGKSHFSYAHVMNLRCIEWVFTRGVSKHNGKQEGLDTGDPLAFQSYEEFYAAYQRQVDHYIDLQCRRRQENFGLSYMIAPDPLMSSILHDCVETGRDISQDGARFIFHQILVTGFSCTVDSLMVVKRLVFEEKSLPMQELMDALNADWVGHERLRARIVNTVPKYGNDIDEVDEIGIRVLHDFEKHVSEWNRKGGQILFPCGVGTFENYAVLGRDIAATPDGRRNREALAPNYSPTPGVDLEGPTAAIKSATKPELMRFYSGTPLDLAINSREVEGEAGIERMGGIIRAFCELGGQVLTLTSANVEDLKDAKVHPERHRSLRVRMGGLSAYFIAMSPVQQDNVIKRFAR